MMTIWSRVRQLVYPQSYRINVFNASTERLNELLNVAGRNFPKNTPGGSSQGLSNQAICELCTNLWRLERRLRDRETGEFPDDVRIPGRHIQSIWDGLQSAGYQIFDHTGERIPEKGISGLVEISFERKNDIESPIVLETVKPTITHLDNVIQMGEVVVGLPTQENA